MKKEQKKSKMGLIVGLTVFSVVVLVGAVFGVPYFLEKQEPIAVQEPIVEEQSVSKDLGVSLIYVEGAVEFKTANAGWQRVEVNQSLVVGDQLEILGEGKAILNFDDGSALRLNSNSTVTLTSLDPNHVVVTNEKGDVYSRVVKADRVFEVVVGETVYQSLGTAYKTFNLEKEKGVEVYQSKVKVVDADKKEVTVDEGKKYYAMKNDEPKKEKVVMDLNKEDLKKDTFIAWNKTEDEKVFSAELGFLGDQAKTETETTTATETSGDAKLTLSAVKATDGIKFSWSVSGIETGDGYKLVKGAQADPVYPGSDYKYINNLAQHSYTWAITDGKTYNFRVCHYVDGKCGDYSNNVQVTAPVKEVVKETSETVSGEVASISLSAAGGSSVKWTVDGYSDQGFKVVWSKNSSPTYPTRSGDKYAYYSSPQATSATLDAFSGAGSYYVRVCEYLGGSCGKYSNQITVSLGDSESDETEQKVSSITIKSNGGGSVSWSVSGYSENGYKLVYSKNSSPTYPTRSGDKYQYFSNPNTKSATIDAFSGSGTYYVRVCEYLGGSCGKYSNQITVSLGDSESDEPEQKVSSISIKSNGGGSVSWTVSGYSQNGYKLVYSKSSGPTYPTRASDKYQYFSDPNTKAATVSAFNGAGTYYVRVCEYLGGACGVYSNQIQIEL